MQGRVGSSEGFAGTLKNNKKNHCYPSRFILIYAVRDEEKRRCRTGDTILFKKYQLDRMIGQGRNGTVYLAFHRELEEMRAIKCVPKASATYAQFRQEALILKELRHPGIPIVYDLEEDLEFSYLIEEYLEGDSLSDLVEKQGSLAQETVIRYGIQICDLVHYLHIAGEIPILYLDLQPKNLLLCHETVKLIDFDHAAVLSEANEADERYGTPGCCAPEQRDVTQTLDIRTDVYAIGSILYYLMTGVYPGTKEEEAAGACGKRLWHVLRTCLQEQREFRYQTAEEVKLALEEIIRHSNVFGKIGKPGMGVSSNKNKSSLTVALIGSRPGVGTTHLSFSLSAYLRRHGWPNLYEEHNRSGAVRRMTEGSAVKADSYGIYSMKNMRLKPWYGAAVSWKAHPYSVVVRDYGTDWKLLKDRGDIDVVLLVCGGAWWDAGAEEEALEYLNQCPNLRLVYNHPMTGVRRKRPAGITGAQCFKVPYFEDPFEAGIQTEACWHEVMEGIWSEKEGVSLRGFLRKLTGKICRKIVSSV